jgi:hypothetical protein
VLDENPLVNELLNRPANRHASHPNLIAKLAVCGKSLQGIVALFDALFE